MVWGLIFLGETVGTSTVVGALVVLAAMGLVLWSSHPRPEDAIAAEA
jgi:drug/metabolite transporter (DMT)-like permease